MLLFVYFPKLLREDLPFEENSQIYFLMENLKTSSRSTFMKSQQTSYVHETVLHYMQRPRKNGMNSNLTVGTKQKENLQKHPIFKHSFEFITRSINITQTKEIKPFREQRMSSHLTLDTCRIPTDWRGASACLYLSVPC